MSMLPFQTYKSDFLDFAVRELLPTSGHLSLMGLEDDTNTVIDSSWRLSPVFLRAFKQYAGEKPNLMDIHERITKAYYEKILSRKNGDSMLYNHSSNGATPEIFDIIWGELFKVTSNKHLRLKSKMFPSDIGRNHKGYHAGILYLLDESSPQTLNSVAYRSVNKRLSHLADTNHKRTSMSLLFLDAILDFGEKALSFNDSTIMNLLSFYDSLEADSETMISAWLSDSWNDEKMFVLEKAKALEKDIFSKLIQADLPLKNWEDHESIPREWLLKLYDKE